MHVPGPGWGSYACNGFSFNVFGVLLNLFRPFLTQNDVRTLGHGQTSSMSSFPKSMMGISFDHILAWMYQKIIGLVNTMKMLCRYASLHRYLTVIVLSRVGSKIARRSPPSHILLLTLSFSHLVPCTLDWSPTSPRFVVELPKRSIDMCALVQGTILWPSRLRPTSPNVTTARSNGTSSSMFPFCYNRLIYPPGGGFTGTSGEDRS